jgi:hypothetical protein
MPHREAKEPEMSKAHSELQNQVEVMKAEQKADEKALSEFQGSAVTTSTTGTYGQYSPRATILKSDLERELATKQAAGTFHELVEQTKVAMATHDYAKAPLIYFVKHYQAKSLRPDGEPEGAPFEFLVRSMALRVIRGEMMEFEYDFSKTLGKGGTAAEWMFNMRKAYDFYGDQVKAEIARRIQAAKPQAILIKAQKA